MANLPSDHVIGAGLVATDADAAHSLATFVQSEPAAEDIYAADYLTDHRIGGRAIGCGFGRFSFAKRYHAVRALASRRRPAPPRA